MVGGPRSGKTQQLVDLAAEWIEGGGDPTKLVLVVRSREGAALLRRRVDAQLGGAHPLLLVQTHEHLASTVLAALSRRGAPEVTLSRTGEWLAMREALRRAVPLPRLGPLVEEPSCTSDALAVVSACKRALVGPGLLAERLRDAPVSLAEIAVVAASYQMVLAEMKCLDRRDSHRLALEALFADRNALQGWAELLLVDEAEDLSPAQWLLIRELGGRLRPPCRLVMVGHWTESTPGFRGVSSESSSRPFEEYFPSELAPSNWALPPALPSWTVEVAGTLGLDLSEEPELAEPAALEALDEAAFRVGAMARVWVAPDETEEALAVAREIARAGLQGEVDFSEVAILVPSRSRLALPIQAALTSLGVPFRSPGGGNLAGQPVVEVALNWLRVLCLPGDDAALLTALAAGPAAVSPASISSLRRLAGRRNLPAQSVFWEWARREQSEPIPDQAQGAEAGAWEQLRAAGRPWLSLGPRDPGATDRQLTGTRLLAILGQIELSSGTAELAINDLELATALAELARAAQTVVDVQRRLGRGELPMAAWLDLLQLAVRHTGGEADTATSGDRSEVTVLTALQAKGRSWSRVFICGCAAGLIPAPAESAGLLDSDEVQELVRRLPELEDVISAGDRQQDAEARLFLVALTRATGVVTCTWARRYQGRAVDRSPFLGALSAAGITEVAAPLAELVNRDDLVTELALAGPPIGLAGVPSELESMAAELHRALSPWDPVAEGAALIKPPLSISATSVSTWLACPRQYLAHLLGPESEPDVNLTLGTQAHRLLELLYRQRAAWDGSPDAFREVADQLLREQLMPEVRADQADPLKVLYVRLWLERLVARWGRRVVAAGKGKVGEPIAEEVAFDLPREGWHLRGTVDALWRHPDGEVELLDYKTARSPLSERSLRAEVFGKPPEGPHQWQLPIYQLAARGGAFAEQLGDQIPTLVRNWYVGAEPGPKEQNPLMAAGFRIVDGEEEAGGPGTLTEAELDRIDREIDKLAEAVQAGHFPAQPRHSQRTCRDGRAGCSVAFWCDGEGSVGRDFPTPNPEL